MKQKLVQVGKEMGDAEAGVKFLLVLTDVPVVIIVCLGLGTWLGLQFGEAHIGLLCGLAVSIPLIVLSVYRIVVFGHREVK